ncbi:EAL domain-containing protein [Massilia horti]|nr:EAL domain-containing protein [Massilia horti]
MKVLAVLGIALAIALPVGLSIYLARHQSLEHEQERALGYAREVLSRSESTIQEVDVDLGTLAAQADGDPCSARNIDLMRRIDFSSPATQSIGVIDNNYIVCLSQTGASQPVYLGRPDVIQPDGEQIWTQVALPFAVGRRFLVLGRGRYVAIVHEELPLMVANPETGLAVAALSGPRRVVLASQGYVDPAWLTALHGHESVSYVDDGHVVAVVASRHFPIDATAALPVAKLDERTWAVARTVVPFGVLTGILLAWATVLLARAQLAMPAVLKAALRRKELFMVYQPVVDLRTGRWVGAEALIRWERPKGEVVRPDVFIEAAEDSGLIQQVTKDVVLEQVRVHAEILFKQFPDFHIAINLAAEDMQSERTVGLLCKLVEVTGAPAGSLMVEATERGFAAPSRVRSIVDGLHAQGIRIAIDDFGTGYSSLSFLESLDFDLLKIDKSFVDTLDTGAATSQVIHHIIEMAKALKMEMIAEGVETEAQAQFLRSRGVHYAQGWLFAHPMSFERLLEALKQEREREAGQSPAVSGAGAA